MIGRLFARARRDPEAGVTLPELIIALSVLLVVTGAFLAVVVNLQTNLARQQDRSVMNDDARLAVDQLDRQIRSGNVLYDPALEAEQFYSLRVYTQANAPTSTPDFRCMLWRIDEQDRLVTRSWPPGAPESASGWSIVAEHIVNVDLGVPAFELSDPSKGGRTVQVTLVVDEDLTDTVTSPIRIQTALTGRNTSLGFPQSVCEDLPA